MKNLACVCPWSTEDNLKLNAVSIIEDPGERWAVFKPETPHALENAQGQSGFASKLKNIEKSHCHACWEQGKIDDFPLRSKGLLLALKEPCKHSDLVSKPR